LELVRLIDKLSVRLRLLRIAQESKNTDQYSEREILLLELIDSKEKISILEITQNFNVLSKSIISSAISNFWKDKLVNKEKDLENQRITYVSLTPKGKKILNTIRKHKDERFSILIKALNLSSEEKETIKQVLERALQSFDLHDDI
jgi:DNA-binding MarR family transcriptional regulator